MHPCIAFVLPSVATLGAPRATVHAGISPCVLLYAASSLSSEPSSSVSMSTRHVYSCFGGCSVIDLRCCSTGRSTAASRAPFRRLSYVRRCSAPSCLATAQCLIVELRTTRSLGGIHACDSWLEMPPAGGVHKAPFHTPARRSVCFTVCYVTSHWLGGTAVSRMHCIHSASCAQWAR